MGFLQDFLGIAPPPAPAPEPVALAPGGPKRGTAAWHRDRFANAIPQYRVALERGETTAARIAELERWHGIYAAYAAADEAAGIEPVNRDDAEEVETWAP